MQSVQYRNMTDEELLRQAYMQGADPLVKELCERLIKLLDAEKLLQERAKYHIY